MQFWRKKFQAEYMSSDIKPSKHKRLSRWIEGSLREQSKKEIRKELEDLTPSIAELREVQQDIEAGYDTYPTDRSEK